MSQITIYGYASFNEWVQAGCPGARSFDANGDVKNPATKLAKCRLCYRSMVQDGLCLDHFEMRRRRAVA